MDDLPFRLARRFRRQQEFTAASSPLSARLCGLIADWLGAGCGKDPLVDWLLAAAHPRASFEVPLLLLAGLHRDVLAGVADARPLGRYFPSAGGTLALDADDLAASLRQAILARREALAEFIAHATVQTNETARGLCWLLPVLFTGWPAIHLLDLGASAGLNLVADQRHYRLLHGEGNEGVLELGCGIPPQFVVHSEGPLVAPTTTAIPTIRSRIGCDLAPFILRSRREEQTLAAFVWGDQSERLARLRQGIAALHQLDESPVPVRLHQADLPDALPHILARHIGPLDDAPLVVFNTYLTTYLRDKGTALRLHLADWVRQHPQPVLWLQWEPPWQGPEPPRFGWLYWTADLWSNGRHRRWHLAWTHPHGNQLQWLPDWQAWANFWRQQQEP